MTPHWSERYLGRAWISGRHECTDLVEAVLRTEFGRRVRFPRAAGVRTRDRLIRERIEEFAVPLDRPPAEGDGVLMRVRGARRAVGCHIGVWCAPCGVPSVLHCGESLGVVAVALDELAGRGLEVAGVYGWR